MSPAHQARLKALFAKTNAPVMVNALRILEDKRKASGLDQFEMITRAWTIDELERLFPVASDAVRAAFEKAEDETAPGDYVEVDYVAVLLANIEI